jgi:hypothetical protein
MPHQISIDRVTCLLLERAHEILDGASYDGRDLNADESGRLDEIYNIVSALGVRGSTQNRSAAAPENRRGTGAIHAI